MTDQGERIDGCIAEIVTRRESIDRSTMTAHEREVPPTEGDAREGTSTPSPELRAARALFEREFP